VKRIVSFVGPRVEIRSNDNIQIMTIDLSVPLMICRKKLIRWVAYRYVTLLTLKTMRFMKSFLRPSNHIESVTPNKHML
jgi:hypothetical protein